MNEKRIRAGVIAAVIAVVFGISLFFSIRLLTKKAEGTVANVYQDGVCVYSVDLSGVREAYELTVTYGEHYNMIQIDRGRIAVKEADCPDGICVQTGYISDSAMPIVCLPHRLVIRLEEKSASGGFDAVTE